MNVHPAAGFLEMLFDDLPQGAAIELRCIEDRKNGKCDIVWCRDVNDVLGRLPGIQERAEADGRAVYFGVLPRKNATSGAASNVASGWVAWCDIDFKDVDEATARSRIDAFPLPPSIIVHSGRGLHLYWLLKEPTPGAECSTLSKRLAASLGADHCFDAARILRLPGTANLKGGWQGDVYHLPASPPVARIERINGSIRYTPADFDDLPAPVDRVEPPREARPRGKPLKSLPDDVRQLIEDTPRLTALWNSTGKTGGDTSNSGYDLSFAMALAGRGIRNPDILDAAVAARPRTDTKVRSPRDIRRTVDLALRTVEADDDREQPPDDRFGPPPGDPPLGEVVDFPPPTWEPPLAFGELYDPASFPLEALPTTLRHFVAGLSEQTQTPPDMAAMFTLSVCSLTLSGRLQAHPRGGWFEPLAVWSAVAMDPGSRKSSVVKECMRPVHAAETEALSRMGDEVRAAKVRKKVLEDRATKAMQKASSATPSEMEGLIREATEATAAKDAVNIPVPPRYFADDVTPEKLIGLLQEHGGRFAVISAEGGPFDMMAGRYSEGVPNLDVYLKGHAGDPIRVDRIGRPPENIENPALTVALALQPDIIRGLAEKPGFRGRGLLGRFLYSVPRSTVGHRSADPSPMPETSRRAYQNLVQQLLDLRPPDATVVHFGADAQRVLKAFAEDLEPKLGEGGSLEYMADWAGKLVGAIVRIAAVLHVVENIEHAAPWTIEVSPQTTVMAITIGEYALDHAVAAFGMMGADPKLTAAKHLLSWIRVNAVESINERDTFQAVKGRFKKMAPFREALEILIEHGYLKKQPRQRGRVGRPSTFYLVNPTWKRA